VTRPAAPAAVGLVLVAATLLAGCVTPAPTTSAYESKAAMTAQAAVSAARTAVTAENASVQGKVTDTYLETVVVDAENELASVQTTFDSVQPPQTAGADALRATVDPLLEEAVSAMEDLRIAVRRNATGDRAQASKQLAAVADRLDAFAQQHQS
jgi:hypothetical protein